MQTSSRAMPSARATHASHRARILGLGLSVGIAIALGGCSRSIIVFTIGDIIVVGILALIAALWALLAVILFAERAWRALKRKFASGMSTGTAKTPEAVEGRSPASPAAKPRRPNAVPTQPGVK